MVFYISVFEFVFEIFSPEPVDHTVINCLSCICICICVHVRICIWICISPPVSIDHTETNRLSYICKHRCSPSACSSPRLHHWIPENCILSFLQISYIVFSFFFHSHIVLWIHLSYFHVQPLDEWWDGEEGCEQKREEVQHPPLKSHKSPYNLEI